MPVPVDAVDLFCSGSQPGCKQGTGLEHVGGGLFPRGINQPLGTCSPVLFSKDAFWVGHFVEHFLMFSWWSPVFLGHSQMIPVLQGNLFAYYSGADLPLSILATSLSTLLSVAMMPLCLVIYSGPFTDENVAIPVTSLVTPLSLATGLSWIAIQQIITNDTKGKTNGCQT